MIPTIQRDRIAFVGGTLHTHFQRTGLSRTARLSSVPVASVAVFSVTAKEREFALTGPAGEIESFRLEKHALSGLNRIAHALSADPNGRWLSHRRYTMLVVGAFLALSAGAGWLNNSSPAHDHDHTAAPAQVAGATGYAAAMAPQAPVAPTPLEPAANSNPPTKRAIHFGRRDAPQDKTLYVFSDPQCPHCRELEKTLAALPADYGVYVFATPFLPGADELAAKIHCASDPKKAWRDAMAGNAVSGSGICDKSSWGKENIAFFRSVGLTATPTIVAGIDGRIRTGATDLPTLLSWMKSK